MSVADQDQQHGAFSTSWPYACVALISALTCIVTFGATLFLGIGIGFVGSVRGALTRTERGRLQGVHILFVGLALLVGPLTYLVLAIAR